MAEVPVTNAPDQSDLMEVDSGGVTGALSQKIVVLPGYAPDMTAATFCLYDEDHTLGNALRYMLMKDANVEFCGYSIPHPSENKVHLRIQMYDGVSALATLHKALSNLEDLFVAIDESYKANLQAGRFERYEENKVDLEQLQKDADAVREKKRLERVEQSEKALAAASKGPKAPPARRG